MWRSDSKGRFMCDCHPLTKNEQAAWNRAKKEPRTRDDWEYLHNMIEGYRRRLIDRELQRVGVPTMKAEKE